MSMKKYVSLRDSSLFPIKNFKKLIIDTLIKNNNKINNDF